MRLFILMLLLLGCESPLMYDKRQPLAPTDTVVAPIGEPPEFPTIKD